MTLVKTGQLERDNEPLEYYYMLLAGIGIGQPCASPTWRFASTNP